MKEINKSEFETILKDDLSVVNFSATWCGPCVQFKPTLEKLETAESVPVYRVDIDKEPGLAQMFGVMSVPTTAIIKSGGVVNTLVGPQTLSALSGHVADARR